MRAALALRLLVGILLAGVLAPASLASEHASTSYLVRGSSFAGSVAPALTGGAGGTLAEEGVVGRSAGGATVTAGFWAIATRERIGACGDGVLGLGEACDDGGTVSGDGCFSTCELETSHAFQGVAVGGYRVEVVVSGVAVSIFTTPAQTAAQVAAALAAAIDADPALQALGISAIAVEGTLVTNGEITSVIVEDPGLLASRLPALSPAVLVLACGLLAILGASALRRTPAPRGAGR